MARARAYCVFVPVPCDHSRQMARGTFKRFDLPSYHLPATRVLAELTVPSTTTRTGVHDTFGAGVPEVLVQLERRVEVRARARGRSCAASRR